MYDGKGDLEEERSVNVGQSRSISVHLGVSHTQSLYLGGPLHESRELARRRDTDLVAYPITH